MVTIRFTQRLVPAVALLLACGGGDLVLPGDGVPASIRVLEGDGQSGRVGTALAVPVIGRVTDAQGRPVADVRVAFAFTDEGAAGSVTPDTGATDADGRATFQVTMGTRIGPVGAELRVAGAASLMAPLAFSAVSADANELHAVAGDDQTAPAGTLLPEPLVVQVTDAFGNPIAGVPITWSTDGGGSLSAASATTGGDGLASVTCTLGAAAGAQRVIASSPGLAGSPVTFTVMAGAGAATTLELVSGDGQSAVVGTALADPLLVRARDDAGNAVTGLAVAWVVGDGGGTLTPVTSLTDESGIASTQWTLGAGPGRNTATAVVSGVGTVGFTATAAPGTPPGLSLETPPPATVVRGVTLSPRPVVQLREPDGAPRPLAGVPVTVTVVQAGATLGGPVVRSTDRDGRAEFRDLVLVGTPGTYTLAFSAPGYTGVNAPPITLVRAATTITIRSDDPDPSTAGAPVRVGYQVQSPGGTPTGVVRVSSDDGANCTATVAAGECSLTLPDAGARTLTATYAGDTQFEGSSATTGHQVNAAAPPVLALRTQPSGTATSGQPFGRQPVVQLRDGQGAELHTAGVPVTVAIASGTAALGGTTTRATDADGRAAFTDLSINGAPGSYTLGFRADGFVSVTSEAITLAPAGPAATTTAITADDPDPSQVGQSVTVHYAVSSAVGAPTGSVAVVASGSESCIGTVEAAACTLTLTQAGTRTLTATYAGDGTFGGSHGTATHTVVAPPAVPSATASTIEVKDASLGLGQRTDVKVTVRDAAGKELDHVTVTLSATGSGNQITPASGATDKKGNAKFQFASSEAGAKTLTAVAAGVTLAQQPTISVAQALTTTRIVSDTPDPSAPGAAATVTFTVTSSAGTPAGDVTVSASAGGSCTAAVAVGRCDLVPVGGGAITLLAAYPGGGSFAASSATAMHTVAAPAPPSLALETEPSDHATVGVPFDAQPEVELRTGTGAPLLQAGVIVGAAVASGGGSLVGSATAVTDGNGRAVFSGLGISGAPGTYTLRFEAPGFTTVISRSIDLRAAATVTSIVLDEPDPSVTGEPVTVQFQVTSDAGPPTGDVTITSSGGESCSASVAQGSCVLTFVAAGQFTLTASYPGDGAFAESSDNESHGVEPAGPPPGANSASTGR